MILQHKSPFVVPIPVVLECFPWGNNSSTIILVLPVLSNGKFCKNMMQLSALFFDQSKIDCLLLVQSKLCHIEFGLGSKRQ